MADAPDNPEDVYDIVQDAAPTLSRDEIKRMVHAFLYDAQLEPTHEAYLDLMLFRDIVAYKLEQSKAHNNKEQAHE